MEYMRSLRYRKGWRYRHPVACPPLQHFHQFFPELRKCENQIDQDVDSIPRRSLIPKHLRLLWRCGDEMSFGLVRFLSHSVSCVLVGAFCVRTLVCLRFVQRVRARCSVSTMRYYHDFRRLKTASSRMLVNGER